MKPRPQLQTPKTLTGRGEIESLAIAGGVSIAFMRKFIKEVMALIEEGLRRDGVVKIHNFGTFRIDETPANKIMPARASLQPRVVFQPAKSLRELILLSLGPAARTGMAISLHTLLEKYFKPSLPKFPTPIAPEIYAEEFDIAEVLPDIPGEPVPVFDFAEVEPVADIVVEKTWEPAPVPARGSPASTFSLAEEESEVETATAPEWPRRDFPVPPIVPPSSRRSFKRWAWSSGAFAVGLLLLLFLLPGRIAEQQDSPRRFVATTTNGAATNNARPISSDQTKSPAANVKPRAPAPFFAGGTHQVARGDNLWGLSGNYYHNHYLWPNIYRVNAATIKNPDILEIAQQLELPVLYGPPQKLTAVDRRNLAESYLLLYRHYKQVESHLAPFALWAAVQYEARIKKDFAAEMREDDLAFLQAHTVSRALAER